ncbi:helix-turn-helix transcriptional regulator [Actinomadura chokoriensis]|uniref:Helix-turn-helix domain-containing protein n=1 Tax=Actinomadura chokoriensis TaxID=454156 RepID=A0ABV4R825_9ACTN
MSKIEEEELKPPEVAALVKVSEQTLANWRSRGYGPPYRKLSDGRSGRVRYRRSAVEAWLTSRELQPGGEAA